MELVEINEDGKATEFRKQMYVNINCNGLNTARLSLSGPTIASSGFEVGEGQFKLKVRGRYKILKGLMVIELNLQ